MNPMEWLGGADQCSLSQSLASSEELEKRGVEVHVHGSCDVEIWKVPRGLLSRSLVVRKMAVWATARERYVLRPTCPDTLRCLGVMIDWPRCPEDVGPWLEACDFLLVSLQLHELAFAVSCAVHSWLAASDTTLCDCSSFEALAHSRRMKGYNALVQLSAASREAPSTDEGMYAYGATEDEEAFTASKGSSQLLLESIRCDALAESCLSMGGILRVLAEACTPYALAADQHLERHAFCGSPSQVHGAVESVARTLLGLTNTAKGSLHLLRDVRSLRAAFGTVAARHFVHRCFCCLYLAESFEEVAFCAVPVETTRDLQELYQEGVLNLCCMVPARDRLCFLLPGLLGAREVSPLLHTAAAIFHRACTLVPWLCCTMRTEAHKFHLTGSFLCWCRTEYEPNCWHEPPGDVDLFCEQNEDLEQAAEHVGVGMLAFARAYWHDATVSVSRPNAYRRVLKIHLATHAERLQEVPSYTLSCDVYMNNLRKVSQYHLPQVRACLWLKNGSPELFLTASAAISWITMLNVDYNAFRGTKTPFEIISRRWLWGFNLCVSESELHLMCIYLRTSHPEVFQDREDMQRPQRLSAHVGCVLRFSNMPDLVLR